MRIKVLAFAASILLISNSSVGSPQTPAAATSSPQAATLLSQAAKALTGSTLVNDVTLTGTAEWIAGSDDEIGTATYKGLAGTYRLDLAFRSGTRSEIVTTMNGIPTGSWIGIDGVTHAAANHNLMQDSGWIPIFALGGLISSVNTVLTYVGQETRNGSAVIHISASQQFPTLPAKSATLMQQLTQAEIFLDPSTSLPVSYVFNSHPDDNALLDIPTEIRYSNYKTFGGVQLPLHVQKFVNSSLTLDLQFQSASLNSGVSAMQIVGQ